MTDVLLLRRLEIIDSQLIELGRFATERAEGVEASVVRERARTDGVETGLRQAIDRVDGSDVRVKRVGVSLAAAGEMARELVAAIDARLRDVRTDDDPLWSALRGFALAVWSLGCEAQTAAIAAALAVEIGLPKNF